MLKLLHTELQKERVTRSALERRNEYLDLRNKMLMIEREKMLVELENAELKHKLNLPQQQPQGFPRNSAAPPNLGGVRDVAGGAGVGAGGFLSCMVEANQKRSRFISPKTTVPPLFTPSNVGFINQLQHAQSQMLLEQNSRSDEDLDLRIKMSTVHNGEGIRYVTDAAGKQHRIKRPANAFFVWSKQRRAQIKGDEMNNVCIPGAVITEVVLPGGQQTEISKQLGREWKALAEEDRNHWKEKSRQEKADHEQKYPNYKFQPQQKTKRQRTGSNTSNNPSNQFHSSSGKQQPAGIEMNPMMMQRMLSLTTHACMARGKMLSMGEPVGALPFLPLALGGRLAEDEKEKDGEPERFPAAEERTDSSLKSSAVVPIRIRGNPVPNSNRSCLTQKMSM
jgi:hypothetical protein